MKCEKCDKEITNCPKKSKEDCVCYPDDDLDEAEVE